MFHTTIKFTAEYSKKEVNLLDLNIKLIDGQLKTNLSVPILNTAKRVYLTVKLNRICSDNENDKRCIDLEKWLMERGYNEQMIRKQILRAGNIWEVIFLREREKPQLSEQKLKFNINYYLAFQDVRCLMEYVLLAPSKKNWDLDVSLSHKK